jgi:uracil-DNA glycosylase
MERGGKFRPESEKFADTQRNFRNAAELRWNPHMGGTSQLVECLVECSDRQLYSTQFALTNAVKCVHATNSQKSSSTGTMIGRCSGHLMAEIERLNPHLVITQGDHPRETVLGLFDWKPVKKFTGQAGEAEVMLTDDFVILTTPHPARKAGWRWSGGPLPKFLQNAVHCAIAELKRDRQ